ncbi:hypothetical protein JAAARDRAFT_140630 [Jaapia argillacea MUCL 33604]|uniref:Uncharacterized protein n=1 Tax=Jaapia argillacea MUCL 33604 TaxID=933084 RepID=A0A067PBJ1_9AGAM|nr:hypothetical protein JAAARDRAFT_140630 [Jaapia argillacea MUCL 33604]
MCLIISRSFGLRSVVSDIAAVHLCNLLQIWDVCVQKESSFFVLTNYNEWVFGSFSDNWRQARVTLPKSYNAASPTILECLVYWISSAMNVPGGYVLDKVGSVRCLIEAVIHRHLGERADFA